MTDREVMRQALLALEGWDKIFMVPVAASFNKEVVYIVFVFMLER